MTVRTTITRWGRIAATVGLVAGVAACGVRSSPIGPEGTTYPLRYPSAATDDPILPASALTRQPEKLVPKPAEPNLDGPALGDQAPTSKPATAAIGPATTPSPGGPPPLILFRPLPEWPAGGPANPDAPPATELIVR